MEEIKLENTSINNSDLSEDEKQELRDQLRKETGFASICCKEALKETNYDINQAKIYLIEHRKKIDYFENVVNISLTRREWHDTEYCVNTMKKRGTRRTSTYWYDDLHDFLMEKVLLEVTYSGKKYPLDDVDITFGVPRELLLFFVYSIGHIAYDIDINPYHAWEAQRTLNRVNEQLKQKLSQDDRWFTAGF